MRSRNYVGRGFFLFETSDPTMEKKMQEDVSKLVFFQPLNNEELDKIVGLIQSSDNEKTIVFDSIEALENK